MAQLLETRWLQICRDIANGTKHYEITKYTPQVTDAAAASGYGIGRFGVGESSITVEHLRSKYGALAVVDHVPTLWTAFFTKHAPGQRGGNAQDFESQPQ